MTHDLAGVQRHPFGSAELWREAMAIVGEAARAGEMAGLVTPHGAHRECIHSRRAIGGPYKVVSKPAWSSTHRWRRCSVLLGLAVTAGHAPLDVSSCVASAREPLGVKRGGAEGGVRPQQQASLEKTRNFWRFSDASCLDLWRNFLWVLGMRSRG
jgi:hypothetical protein